MHKKLLQTLSPGVVAFLSNDSGDKSSALGRNVFMEIWKDVVGFEGIYQCSNLGRIISLKWGNKKFINGSVSGCGYVQLVIYSNKIKKRIKLHRVIALAFIENPEHKLCINHKNGNKLDNRVENLEWCTHSENIIHAYKTGLWKPVNGERQGSSKLKEADVIKIKELLKTKLSQEEIASGFNINRKVISLIKNNMAWKHVQ